MTVIVSSFLLSYMVSLPTFVFSSNLKQLSSGNYGSFSSFLFTLLPDCDSVILQCQVDLDTKRPKRFLTFEHKT